MAPTGWRRIGYDLKQGRFIDAYSVAFVAFILAVLSLIPDVVPDPIRWAVLLGGLGILVLRITVPDSADANIDDFLGDRFALDATPFQERLKNATEVWVFAPSAINILSAHNCELFRTRILDKPQGVIRVVVLNPTESNIGLATRQLDDSLDYPIQDFRDSLQATLRQLRTMSGWKVVGSLGYRFLDYNPGFSLVAIDPAKNSGQIIVEFHGFHNEATSSRMHIELSRRNSKYWYAYWTNQFDRIWEAALEIDDHQ
jgi:hypothetical protein